MKNNGKENVIIQASGYKDGKLTRICTKCGKEKPLEDFGLRKMDKEKGPVRNQAQCKKCR